MTTGLLAAGAAGAAATGAAAAAGAAAGLAAGAAAAAAGAAALAGATPVMSIWKNNLASSACCGVHRENSKEIVNGGRHFAYI